MVIKNFILFLSVAAFIAGCKSNTTQVIYTNDGKPGTIVGQISLYDSLLDKNSNSLPISDASGVTVTIEGTSLQGQTDKDGIYSITNVPPGAYWLIFSKDGYSTDHYGVIEFAGNGTDIWSTTLYRTTHKTPSLVLRPFDSTGVATFTFRILDQLQQYEYGSAYLYFGKTDAISPSDPSSYLYLTTTSYRYPDETSADIAITKTQLLSAGFSPNETIYCVAYTGNPTEYIDLKTLKYNFIGFSPYTSGVKNFVLPP
jgi:hypothetical protein